MKEKIIKGKKFFELRKLISEYPIEFLDKVISEDKFNFVGIEVCGDGENIIISRISQYLFSDWEDNVYELKDGNDYYRFSLKRYKEIVFEVLNEKLNK